MSKELIRISNTDIDHVSSLIAKTANFGPLPNLIKRAEGEEQAGIWDRFKNWAQNSAYSAYENTAKPVVDRASEDAGRRVADAADSEFGEKAKGWLDSAKQTWNDNPALQYGAMGAGAGALVGAGSNLLGNKKKKRPFSNAILGGLLGGTAAAGGKYLYDQFNSKQAPTEPTTEPEPDAGKDDEKLVGRLNAIRTEPDLDKKREDALTFRQETRDQDAKTNADVLAKNKGSFQPTERTLDIPGLTGADYNKIPLNRNGMDSLGTGWNAVKNIFTGELDKKNDESTKYHDSVNNPDATKNFFAGKQDLLSKHPALKSMVDNGHYVNLEGVTPDRHTEPNLKQYIGGSPGVRSGLQSMGALAASKRLWNAGKGAINEASVTRGAPNQIMPGFMQPGRVTVPTGNGPPLVVPTGSRAVRGAIGGAKGLFSGLGYKGFKRSVLPYVGAFATGYGIDHNLSGKNDLNNTFLERSLPTMTPSNKPTEPYLDGGSGAVRNAILPAPFPFGK